MSETATAPQGAPPAGQQPPLVVNIQYVKDLSFEVPGAPAIFTTLRAQPQVAINLDVQARRVHEGQTQFEVSIVIRAEAHDNSQQGNGQASVPAPTVFVAELTYAGVFRIVNVPQENLHPMIMIECPRLLFPFAREIIATAVRDGGFPPLMLDPVDFVGLYRQNMERQAAAQAAQPKPS